MKYLVQFSWHEHVRGYGEVEIEANNAEDAKQKAMDEDLISWDLNDRCKTIDSDWDIDSVKEVIL